MTGCDSLMTSCDSLTHGSWQALWDEQLLDAHFTLSMYKHMLNLPIDYKDVEAVDPDYYRNLSWMLTNSIDNVVSFPSSHIQM